MRRFVVQSPSAYFVLDAPSPRAAAMLACGTTSHVIVWYRTRNLWAAWTDSPGSRTRYLGKPNDTVAALLTQPSENS